MSLNSCYRSRVLTIGPDGPRDHQESLSRQARAHKAASVRANPEYRENSYPTRPDRSRGLRLQLLTACRISEVLGAVPAEFDLKTGTWTVSSPYVA